MQAVHVLALVVALLVLPARADAHRRGRPERVSCPTDVAAAVAERCPCDGARNHGQYVLCVARYAAALRKARCIADAWSFTRCAARSTCGKSTAVVCCLAQPGTCTAGGVCDDDGETACTTDADCTTVRARIARDAGRCTAAGGVLGAGDSVCGGCAATTTSTTTTTTEPTTTSTIPTTTSTSTTTTVTVTTTTTTTETLASTTTTTVPPGVTFGNAVEFPDASAHAPDYLLGSPVTLPAPMTVTRLCLIAKGDGPNVVMVLYSSDNFGRPMHPVAWTPTTPLTAGRMEIPVSPTVLAAGRYWITAVYDTDASVGIDETDPLAPVDYVDHPFSSPAPDPFGAAASYTGQKFNYYVRAQ